MTFFKPGLKNIVNCPCLLLRLIRKLDTWRWMSDYVQAESYAISIGEWEREWRTATRSMPNPFGALSSTSSVPHAPHAPEVSLSVHTDMPTSNATDSTQLGCIARATTATSTSASTASPRADSANASPNASTTAETAQVYASKQGFLFAPTEWTLATRRAHIAQALQLSAKMVDELDAVCSYGRLLCYHCSCLASFLLSPSLFGFPFLLLQGLLIWSFVIYLSAKSNKWRKIEGSVR